jgi:hypothetical protein
VPGEHRPLPGGGAPRARDRTGPPAKAATAQRDRPRGRPPGARPPGRRTHGPRKPREE